MSLRWRFCAAEARAVLSVAIAEAAVLPVPLSGAADAVAAAVTRHAV